MAGMLNQAAPFLATCGFTLLCTKAFFGNTTFNRKVIAELETINAEVAKQADSNKDLRAQLKTVATEMKKMKDASAAAQKVTEAATKNLQKQLDSLTQDLAEGKKISLAETQARQQELEQVRTVGSKLEREQAEVASALSKLELGMQKCGDVSSQIAAMQKQQQKQVVPDLAVAIQTELPIVVAAAHETPAAAAKTESH